MKKYITLLVIIISTTFAFSQSQEVLTKNGKKVILKSDKTWEYVKEKVYSNETDLEPEYSSRPYFVKNGNLKSLEKVKAEITVKIKAFGYGGSSTYLIAFGRNSKISFEKDNIPKIIVKVESNEDPEDFFTVLKHMSKKSKDRRRFTLASRALMGKARDVSKNEVEFEIKKIKNNIYEIIFEDLEYGEYAIIPQIKGELSPGSVQRIYCFGIE
ncbi:MAG: hypothetical protein COB98_02670 [Flavobacteriaceae bacterium]|nr:MAG: hypothetical protein COB98_02670 [Flavobacteriaceae bacterium]